MPFKYFFKNVAHSGTHSAFEVASLNNRSIFWVASIVIEGVINACYDMLWMEFFSKKHW